MSNFFDSQVEIYNQNPIIYDVIDDDMKKYVEFDLSSSGIGIKDSNSFEPINLSNLEEKKNRYTMNVLHSLNVKGFTVSNMFFNGEPSNLFLTLSYLAHSSKFLRKKNGFDDEYNHNPVDTTPIDIDAGNLLNKPLNI